MQLTGLLLLLLIISGIVIAKNKGAALRPFDQATTGPLRGILALMIVAHHIPKVASISSFNAFFWPVGMPVVAVFFLLSGYGLGISFIKKKSKYLQGFLKKRYSKILPAFLALTILAATVLFVIGGRPVSTQVSNLVLRGLTPLPNTWFIFAILYTYAAFYLSALLGKTLRRTGLYLVICNVVYIVVLSQLTNYGSYWYVTIPSVNLGYYLALYENKIDSLILRRPLTVYASAVAITFLSFCAEIKMASLTSTTYIIWDGVWAFCLAGACYLIIRALGTIRWRPLIWLGGISMEIYLIHGLTIAYTRHSGLFPLDNTLNCVLFIILVYTVSILCGWAVHKITAKKAV